MQSKMQSRMIKQTNTKSTFIKINSPLDLGYYRGNIVFIHNYRHKTFRYIAFGVNNDCFNNKTKALKLSDCYDCSYEVNRIEILSNNVNRAIIELSKTRDTITKLEVDAYIATHLTEVEINSSESGVIADFTEWIERYKKSKNDDLIRKGKQGNKNHPSAKDYTSAKNLLIDFQWDFQWDNDKLNKYKKQLDVETGECIRKFMYDDIDNEFILELVDYCYLPRINTKSHRYKTQGDMVNKTIQKRMDSLFSFLKSQYGSKLPNGILKPNLEVVPTETIRLDIGELKLLEELDISSACDIKIRDYFLFLCYTGLRYGDFVKLNKTFVNKESNELHLTTQKTGVNCRIFLFDKAKEIGEKYDYSFTGHTNQSLNKGIKQLLQHYKLYSELVSIQFMKKGLQAKNVPKNEVITCHTGRKTFISIMVENGLDVYGLMGMTGHRKTETLKHYLDLYGKVRLSKLQQINKKLKNI